MNAATETRPAPAKPRVHTNSPTHFSVTFLGQSGLVYKDEHSDRWHAARFTGESVLEGIHRVCWQDKEAFTVLIERLGDVADCQAALVAADAAESSGIRDRIEQLGGIAALAAYDAALIKLQGNDVSGLGTVTGMIKAASGRKLPKAVNVPAADYAGRPYRVRVVPGFSVQINEQVYFIGGQAEYGSYNLHYFGEIKSITEKSVTISQDDTGRSSCKRLKIDEFAWRNASDPASKHADNIDTMQRI